MKVLIKRSFVKSSAVLFCFETAVCMSNLCNVLCLSSSKEQGNSAVAAFIMLVKVYSSYSRVCGVLLATSSDDKQDNNYIVLGTQCTEDV